MLRGDNLLLKQVRKCADHFIRKKNSRLEKLCFNYFGLVLNTVGTIYNLRLMKLEAHPVKFYNISDIIRTCGYNDEITDSIRQKVLTHVHFQIQ